MQAIPLLSSPAEVDHRTVDAKNIDRYEGKGFLGGLTDLGGAGSGGAGGMNMSTLTSENIYRQYNSGGQVEVDYRVGGMATGQERFYSKNQFGVFDGMALPYEFLGEYYFNVSRPIVNENAKSDNSLRDAKKKICIVSIYSKFDDGLFF